MRWMRRWRERRAEARTVTFPAGVTTIPGPLRIGRKVRIRGVGTWD